VSNDIPSPSDKQVWLKRKKNMERNKENYENKQTLLPCSSFLRFNEEQNRLLQQYC